MKVRALFLVVTMALMVAVSYTSAPAGPNAKSTSAVAATPAPAGEPVPEEYKEIRNAIDALATAKAFLIHSDKDFNGHKRDAIGASDTAMQQLRFCLNETK